MKMKVIFSCLLMALLLTLLGGCGSITASIVGVLKRYEDTNEPKQAKLRVIYDMFDHVYISKSKFCSVGADPEKTRLMSKPIAKSGLNIVSGNSVTFEEKILGMPLKPFEMEKNLSRVFSEFYIPANGKLLMEYRSQAGGPGGRYCPAKRYVFSPEPDKDYETEILLVGGRCFYRMQEISNGERKFVQDRFVPAESENCTDDNAQSLAPRGTP